MMDVDVARVIDKMSQQIAGMSQALAIKETQVDMLTEHVTKLEGELDEARQLIDRMGAGQPGTDTGTSS